MIELKKFVIGNDNVLKRPIMVSLNMLRFLFKSVGKHEVKWETRMTERPDMEGPWRGGYEWSSCPLGDNVRKGRFDHLTHPLKAKLIDDAMSMAADEAGDGRVCVVLVPDMTWTSYALRRNVPENVFVRSTTNRSGLMSLRVGTLFLVAPDASTWDKHGEETARRHMLREGSRIINVGGKP